MITINNFKNVLENLEFIEKNGVYSKKFEVLDFELKVDFKNETLIYPEETGFKINERQTCNFKQAENFVVFECVHRLLHQGYHPKHIELEQTYSKMKKDDGGGRADIVVKNNDEKVLIIIECKTIGNEFTKHWQKTLQDGDQLFRYIVNKRETQFLCMYTSDFTDNKLIPTYHLISLNDNKDYLKENPTLLSFENAKKENKEDIFNVWKKTYGQEYSTLGLFES
ncbi:MAG: Type I restriction-modification system, DNA-methyltransferase subunit M (EC / Type I restriction-modification system, specificity subunit S (EC, partial [uncultured Sulfurovum sp.]